VELPASDFSEAPFVHLCEKDLVDNARQRIDLVRQGYADPEVAKTLYTMCARDILFWLNAFAWTYDPRLEEPIVPFVTWPYQDDTILTINQAITDGEDVLIEKSRDMGASWMILMVYLHRWHFRRMQSFLLVSRKEDLVDKTGDPKSLMWKMDFVLSREPSWLRPNFQRTRLHLANLDTGGVIDGESTTGDVARGDRRTGIMLDEFASVEEGNKVLRATRDATDSRALNSTPKGQGNAFYASREKFIRSKNGKVITLFWTLHPHKAKGLYIDPQSEHIGGVNKGERSPWFDKQCERAAHTAEIAQELNIDYLGSDYVFIDPGDVQKLINEFARKPYQRTELEFHHDTLMPIGLAPLNDGRLDLWMNIPPGGAPPARLYVIGGDVATGTGSTPTVLSVGDVLTGEKVARFKCNTIRPEEAARYCIALARWFNNAFVIWEANGPGRNFGDAIIENGYREVYFRAAEQTLSRKSTDAPGWFSTKENKVSLLGNYRRSLLDRTFINRSAEGLLEFGSYVYTQNGSVEHSKTLQAEDPTAGGVNHGDEAIADALLCKGLARSDKLPKQTSTTVPEGSFAWRRQQRLQEAAREDEW